MINNTITACFLLILTLTCFGQEIYVVTAENGLTLRESENSNSKKIGKLDFGAEVRIERRTKTTQTITDQEKEINGTWVLIKFENFPYRIAEGTTGFVFDGYLKKKTEKVQELKLKLAQYPKFQNLTIHEQNAPFYQKGDFFGDETDDLAILVKDSSDKVKIAFINYGFKNTTFLLGDENDPFGITNYGWAEIFEKVNKGTYLWSNYEDDFIEYEDVPESDKVKLKYDALFMHASESCGGGFVYWKNGKFNWLQQE